MEDLLLRRFDIEKIANCLLPKMVNREKDGSIKFDFISLGICYNVEYRKDRNGYWLLYEYENTSISSL